MHAKVTLCLPRHVAVSKKALVQKSCGSVEVNNHDNLISLETPSLTKNQKTPPEASSEEQHNVLGTCMTRLQQKYASCLESLLIDFWLNTILLSLQHVGAEGPASVVSGQTASATAQHHALTA